ncbi:hypothetical protein ACFVWR_02370 [Leifsonia sp. NPDC058292]|uniref:hypothetical protein n=1 Tax=Leifsonia sp. NPDC058292 TaxID=3346428 RepID=UPI0036DA1346
MTDARDDALETPSGEPLDTDPDEDATDGREPYDADGFVEPERHDPAGDDEDQTS